MARKSPYPAFFTHPREPGVRPPAQILHEGISRTCRRFGLHAPWVHTGDCKYGADIGRTWRGSSWMGQRGLHLQRLPL